MGLVRKDEALRRFLGKRVTELEQCPEITSILKSSFGRTKLAIQALRFSDQTCAIEFLEAYDSAPDKDRDYLPLEAFVIKAGVRALELLGAVFSAAQSTKRAEGALLAVNKFPEVLKAGIQAAQLAGGTADRKMLYESAAVGFLPTPKGISIGFNLLNGNPQLSKHGQDEDDGGGDDYADDHFEEMFPSINSKLEKWSDERRKLLAEKN